MVSFYGVSTWYWFRVHPVRGAGRVLVSVQKASNPIYVDVWW
jgi:hypothetical protein